MVTTLEALDRIIMAQRKAQAYKHDPACASLKAPDGECWCEKDGVYCWCTHCGAKFSAEQRRQLQPNSCPSCATRGVPFRAIDDVTVKVNWHELRIIVMWAEHYAHQIDSKPPYTPDEERGCMAAHASRSRQS